MATPPPARAGRLDVAVLGAGRVGPVLGAALRGAGHRVVGVHARSAAAAERVAALLPDVPLVTAEQTTRADLVLLAVPDDALARVVADLAAAGAWRAGQLVVHTSGRAGTSVLAPAAAAGALPLALHPAMTFTGTSLDLPRLASACFAVTAPPVLLPVAQALVHECGATPVVVAEEERPLYHAALAHGANHLVTLVAQAAEALRPALAGADGEVDGETVARVLRPLLQAALDNALASGDAALTGPVARGDAGTVAGHLAVLRERGGTGTAAVYAQAAEAALGRAAESGRLAPAAAAAVRAALGARRELGAPSGAGERSSG
ncbi:putative short-subunit dehydrogenase-like oxidoreductase (DUF2520 family) [Kineococcus xinjiangensis]|uniref:Putative short-subunit dehydrogenase-like oxidoreductase (DUF2520 family) n=1 Tax=Kineococcus xinjiangensis TaxID=512762 RepID=A0A2S6IGW0_9ACTN|nr:Rossmann-like and DUF2520 domain-containing protein [Kineococcus xinjiangensis]PPK93452.1 putative short-subunit dehydrogenase-like oxidoreductase (DUF2520 family) [Kineococcus xinjiangensis]